ncbi:PREDICTED: serine/threonine-protein kinase MRCK alpha [Tarenaya hassleriana]|uniref:serine/threonine-protein kinase MRCK alpha n=1 Tax=Tarenaya hassleriana TaxID=28532 RepID=UPI00053C8D4D|nr:PREDICTED: serine/threonine-protein kinase MRCK alpha [Tarenaya hassleriana]XP_010553817.1 PREDICTED: serine/threonine-protein kinase MRCK alpha [Tarenaya hassleriana]
MFSKSRASSWSRLLVYRNHLRNPSIAGPAGVVANPPSPSLFSRNFSVSPHFPRNLIPWNAPQRSRFSTSSRMSRAEAARALNDLRMDIEKDRERERQERRRQGLDTKDIDAEDEEDYLGIGPFIEKLEKLNAKETGDLNRYEEPTDSDSEFEEIDWDAERKKDEIFKKKHQRHKDLLQGLADCETLDEASKWMNKIDKFEEKHFKIRAEYRVIGELMNRLKVLEGKEKFILQQKLNRAMKLVEWKESFDPNNPFNYGVIERENAVSGARGEKTEKEKEQLFVEDRDKDDDDGKDEDEEFDDMKERDDMLLEKLNAIDKKLEQKLAELEHTFGKKGKLLEEEIRDLAEERNALTEKTRQPFYRKGFDVRTIDVNRVCKVTKGGRKERYTALMVCGNYEGVIGYAKAKADTAQAAMQKAYEKCFQNLHYIERHEEHTIAHAIQTSYKKTKLYLWPAPTRTGMAAGRIVKTILNLAGFKNIKSKVIGSRNPYNTVKAVLKALNAIETPKDVQEKLGRTVVEKYLL